MFYTVYKITNWYNGKIYIGMHKTSNLNDDYMGSGKLIKRAQEKYGIQYFTKEYLAIFDNPDDMYEMESSLVNEKFIERDDTYNIMKGGCGGFTHCNTNIDIIVKRDTYKNKRSGYDASPISNPDSHRNTNHLQTDEAREKRKESLKKYYENGGKGSFCGKSHTEETLQKMRKSKNAGDKNQNYGKMWITNGIDSVTIPKEDPIPEGWRKGRIIKKFYACELR